MTKFTTAGVLAASIGLFVAGTADAQIVVSTSPVYSGGTYYYYPSAGVVQTTYAQPYYSTSGYGSYVTPTYNYGTYGAYNSAYQPYYGGYNTGYGGYYSGFGSNYYRGYNTGYGGYNTGYYNSGYSGYNRGRSGISIGFGGRRGR